jgi:4a-hydroxytetrahydrobiopterin dehydratase
MSSSPLTKDEIIKAMHDLQGWQVAGDSIQKSLTFNDFKQAMSFMVSAGFEAEALAHHPEWKNVYNRVEITLSTHDAGNKVTQKDIDLAKRIDKLVKN